MTIKTTRWSPDTCDCIISYDWDDSVPAESRVHIANTIEKDCPEHSGLGTPDSFYNAILDENTRKNKAWGHLVNTNNFPDLAELDPNGEVVLKNGVIITWNFTGQDDARVLNVNLSGTPLTTNQKSQVQSWVDTNFGVGKVLIIG
jgi:hypothetical protein